MTNKNYPYQVMPPLSAKEYDALKEDIRANGVLVPIEYDECGCILDGHNRLQICEELGITNFPKVIRAGLNHEEKRSHARRINLLRRHLSRKAKQLPIQEQLKETPHLSDRAIGSILGVDGKTVATQRDLLISTAEIPQLPSTVGEDGRTRSRPQTHPQTRPPRMATVFQPSVRDTRLAKNPEVIDYMIENNIRKPTNANRLINLSAKNERKNRPYQLKADDLQLFTADIYSGLPTVPDNSVDLILCDPPYADKHIDLYRAVGECASRVLKNGGSLLAMCVTANLDKLLRSLSDVDGLDYHWLICCKMQRRTTIARPQKVFPQYKPIIWYTKGKYTGDMQIDLLDTPKDDGTDKLYHKWGQSLGLFEMLVERFTDPGQTVLDPFLGGGTTGVAAIGQNRKFVGCDIDEKCVEISRKRINQLFDLGTICT